MLVLATIIILVLSRIFRGTTVAFSQLKPSYSKFLEMQSDPDVLNMKCTVSNDTLTYNAFTSYAYEKADACIWVNSDLSKEGMTYTNAEYALYEHDGDTITSEVLPRALLAMQQLQGGSSSAAAAAAASGEQGVNGLTLQQTDSQASIASTNSDLENLMQTLSGGSLTAPEAKKRATVLDTIDKQAVEFKNEADVVRATRLVELKARESVEDFSGHAHQTGTFY